MVVGYAARVADCLWQDRYESRVRHFLFRAATVPACWISTFARLVIEFPLGPDPQCS